MQLTDTRDVVPLPDGRVISARRRGQEPAKSEALSLP